jgi:hypothetical protein
VHLDALCCAPHSCRRGSAAVTNSRPMAVLLYEEKSGKHKNLLVMEVSVLGLRADAGASQIHRTDT